MLFDFSQQEASLPVRAPPSATTVARTILSAGRGAAIVIDDESDSDVCCIILFSPWIRGVLTRSVLSFSSFFGCRLVVGSVPNVHS